MLGVGFGKAVKRWRRARKINGRQLSLKIGCAENYIYRIENESRRPSRQVALNIGRALGIGDDEVMRAYFS